MGERNSLLLEIVRTAPGTILQINAGDLSEFAGEIVGGVIEALDNANAKRTEGVEDDASPLGQERRPQESRRGRPASLPSLRRGGHNRKKKGGIGYG